jgi:hypothetical protein
VLFQFFNSATDGAPILKIPALGLDLAVRLPPEMSGEALWRGIARRIRFDLCWAAHHGPFSAKDEDIDIN